MGIKKFKDLIMKKHPTFPDGVQARMDFDNGFGVSVIKGQGSYGYPDKWELAVMSDGVLCYDSGITDDVLGYLTELEVTEYMKQVQELN